MTIGIGDCQPEYFAKMDEHLAATPRRRRELVFCPVSNLFERMVKMQSATVLPE